MSKGKRSREEAYLHSLQSAKIVRMHRRFEFIDERTYAVYTRVTIENTGKSEINLIPVDTFPKVRSIDFKVIDNDGTLLARIPSDLNDYLLIRHMFLQSYNSIPKSEIELRDKVLFRLFFNRDKKDGKDPLVQAASLELNGMLAKELKEFLWWSKRTLVELLEMKVKSLLHKKSDLESKNVDIAIRGILDQKVVDGLSILEKCYTQLVQLNNPILPGEFRIITCENTYFIDYDLPWTRLFVNYEKPIPLYLPLFGHDYSLNLELIPPAGMKSILNPTKWHLGKGRSSFKAKRWIGNNIEFHEDLFCILHDEQEQSTPCSQLLNHARIWNEQDDRKPAAFEENNEKKQPDIRAAASERSLAIYFRAPEPSAQYDSHLDTVQHHLRFRFGLSSNWVAPAYTLLVGYLLTLLAVVIILRTGGPIIELEPFWAYLVTGFIQLLTIMFDLSQRSSAERAVLWKIPALSVALLGLVTIMYLAFTII